MILMINCISLFVITTMVIATLLVMETNIPVYGQLFYITGSLYIAFSYAVNPSFNLVFALGATVCGFALKKTDKQGRIR